MCWVLICVVKCSKCVRCEDQKQFSQIQRLHAGLWALANHLNESKNHLIIIIIPANDLFCPTNSQNPKEGTMSRSSLWILCCILWAGLVHIGKCDSHFPQPQVPNSLSPDLVISPVHLKDAGFYICRVNCGDAFEFSQWAQVDVLDVAMPYGKMLQVFKSHLWLLFPALCAMFRNVLSFFFSFHLNPKLEYFSQWDRNLWIGCSR